MAEEATMHATTQADGAAHGGEHGPELLGLSGEGWVYVGLSIFFLIAIFVAKAPKMITSILDDRIAETRRTLDEARAIRAEAEALLKNAQAQSKASAGDATAILENAEAEAKVLLADAKKHAAELTARRGKMAEDKIAAAERSAVAEVRAKAASAAASVAAQVIAQSHDVKADKSLVDAAIARLN
jgi:F-type H+-transporting ATPase subunit b